MGERELILNAKEMAVVEVICSKCGGGVIFDAANESQNPPTRCPSCDTVDLEMSSWLLGYRMWYQAIVKSQKKFRFRVPLRNE